MDAEFVLIVLLWIALLFAVALILISTAMVGRKVADLEFQVEAGIDGVRRIQSFTNLRTHLNRVLLGVVFVLITVLLLANAPIEWRTWSNRVMFAILMVSYTVSSVMDWRAERKQMRILQARTVGSNDRAIAAGVASAAVPPGPEPATAVDVKHLQPPAVEQIVIAAAPVIVDAVADALPSPPARHHD